VISAIFHLRGAPDGATVEVLRAWAGVPAGAAVASATVRDGAARVDGLQIAADYVALITSARRCWSVGFRTSGRNVNGRGPHSGTVRLVQDSA
jgi:hypothetical protein